MNVSAVFQQIRFNEVFDITNPRYKEPIGQLAQKKKKKNRLSGRTYRKTLTKLIVLLRWLITVFGL